MALYILGQVVVKDIEGFAPSMELTPKLIARHGGEVLDVTQAFDVLEGQWPDGALNALVRFPDEASARASWDVARGRGDASVGRRRRLPDAAQAPSLRRS